MTRTDGSATADSPLENAATHATGGLPFNAEQRNAVDFLRSKPGKAAKVLLGDPSTGKTTVLNRFCAEVEDRIVLRSSGAGATHSFMASLLRSAGLNPEKLSRAVRENLLSVFLEHQKTIGRRVVIAVDGADQLTTADWMELGHLQTLHREDRADLELIIVGRPKVYEDIRSPAGGWRCVGARFHTLGPTEKPEPRDLPTESDHLIVSQYGDVMDRLPLKTRTLIGRNVHNDVCLKHPNVSRHHAIIANTPEGYYVVDLNSKNGLTVNGKRVTSAVLRDNDIMVLGPYRIKFVARGYLPVGDPRPPQSSLSDTASMRVKQLRRHLESCLLGVKSAS